MDDKEQNFVVALADACKTHEDWLTVIRFGLPTLLDNQPFLMELIVREAGRLAEGELSHSPAEEARTILAELGLKLAVA